jgi:hemolysin III
MTAKQNEIEESHLINNFYTRREEIANTVTHGLGAILAASALVTLIIIAARLGNVWHVVSFTVYGITLLLLYTASTMYHAVQNPRLRNGLRKFDHAVIYVFIAGTYTPFLLLVMRDSVGWPLLIIVWALAAMGVAFKTLFIDRFGKLETLAYIAMGWLCIFAFKEMITTMPPGGLYWLLAGGIVYTVGVVFFMWDSLPYNHAVWHLFVMAGSVCHFFAITFHVFPYSIK